MERNSFENTVSHASVISSCQWWTSTTKTLVNIDTSRDTKHAPHIRSIDPPTVADAPAREKSWRNTGREERERESSSSSSSSSRRRRRNRTSRSSDRKRTDGRSILRFFSLPTTAPTLSMILHNYTRSPRSMSQRTMTTTKSENEEDYIYHHHHHYHHYFYYFFYDYIYTIHTALDKISRHTHILTSIKLQSNRIPLNGTRLLC